jgi:hypothetical protein
MTVRICAPRFQARHGSACPSRQKRDSVNSAEGKRRTGVFDGMKFTGAISSLLKASALHRARSHRRFWNRRRQRTNFNLGYLFVLFVIQMQDVASRICAIRFFG